MFNVNLLNLIKVLCNQRKDETSKLSTLKCIYVFMIFICVILIIHSFENYQLFQNDEKFMQGT